MADDKSGRDKQALDEENRQRQREIEAELERGDEPEPPVEPAELTAFEAELESVSFPATGAAIVSAVGEYEVAAQDETYRVAELVPETDEETFESPVDVRTRVQRPSVAAALKRVLEASEGLPEVEFRGSQWDAYAKTFHALQAIDADDDDEGISVVTDWVLEQAEEKRELPGSRRLRNRAAKFCRANGYEIRDDQWLGA